MSSDQVLTTQPRILYLIQCHASASFAKLLFRSIYCKDHLYVFHFDRKAPVELAALVFGLSQAFSNVLQLDSEFISWGGYSQIDILVRAIKRFTVEDGEWTHLIVLSEQHLPLLDQISISSALQPNISWVDAAEFSNMHKAAQEDILHRFDMTYQEVPGVAPFAKHKAILPTGFLDSLKHASNWFVLSRQACIGLQEQFENVSIASVFMESLQADETLVPTLLALQKHAGMSLPILPRNATFIGYPHLSGTGDLTFSEKNFFDASSEGYLFIRKRPYILPNAVLSAIESMCVLSSEQLEDVLLSNVAVQFAVAPYTEIIHKNIGDYFSNSDPDLKIVSLKQDEYQNMPRFFLQLTKISWQNQIAIYVLSENIRSFKVSLICLEPIAEGLQSRRFGQYLAVLTKARIHGVGFNRDVIDTNDPNRGFVQINNDEDMIELVSCIENWIATADSFFEGSGTFLNAVCSG